MTSERFLRKRAKIETLTLFIDGTTARAYGSFIPTPLSAGMMKEMMMADRGIYQDDLAERLKARAGQKYRPSNGTEGDCFQDNYCAQCTKDAAYRNDEGDSCPILAWTFAVDVSDPKYPAEWQYGPDGQPTCTAFEPSA